MHAMSLQELDLTVEEEFLDLLLKLVRELPLADIYQMDAQPTSHPMQSSQGIQTALQVGLNLPEHSKQNQHQSEVSQHPAIWAKGAQMIPHNSIALMLKIAACLGSSHAYSGAVYPMLAG